MTDSFSKRQNGSLLHNASLLITALTVAFTGTILVARGLARVQTQLSLPSPYATPSAVNPPEIAPPPDFSPRAPDGFKVSIFARGFNQPRWLAVAPNGDVFVADSADGRVIVLRDPRHRGTADSRETFAGDLNLPFGLAFHRDYVYVADINEVIRFRYDPATSVRAGAREHVLYLPGIGFRRHWTRSLAFSPNGKRLFISVGSETNVSIERDPRRAAILCSDPEGRHWSIYASGLRNAVGLGFNSESGGLWAAVNERDGLGDDLPPDYFTAVVPGGFYGWPYSYIGGHIDDRVKPQRPDLVAKPIVPDLLLGAHVAPLQFAFYESQLFPAQYRHGAFLAEHGSRNRRERSGYQVVFIPFHNGRPMGPPTPFLTGFVGDPNGKIVFGRVVGVAVAQDGSLLVSDDGGKVIWRVSR